MGTGAQAGTLFNLIVALSDAMDMVSSLLADHHRRTAWFAVRLAENMGFSEEGIKQVLFAALLHDVGAFSLKERLDTLNFEFENPHHHACLGFRLLHDFKPLIEEAKIILAHHTWWEPDNEDDVGGDQVPAASHVIHLADRIAILLEEDCNIIDRSDDILNSIITRSGTMFMPEAVEVLQGLSLEEEFWFEVFQTDVMEYLRLKVDPRTMNLSIEDLEELVPVFARIIDYRSHFTATHSSGVAAVAEVLARILGFSEENCRIIRIAGYLHDLGKLAVPTELLEKRSHLDQREYINIQDHVVHTHRLLENVPALGYGIIWASQHHERMDGSGYPDHSVADEIAFGSRVVAVADIFTAVTEKRPYRESMSRNEALMELKHLTDRGYLDKEVFMAITSNYEVLDTVRREAQAAALDDYRERMTPFLNGGDECEGVN